MGKSKAELEAIPGGKRGRGRPVGSKNKPKESTQRAEKEETAAAAPTSPVGAADVFQFKPKGVNPLHRVPRELLQSLALMPETMVAGYVAKKSGGAVRLELPAEAARAVVEATDAWLKSLDFELTPGWVLLGAHMGALGVMFMLAGEELKKNGAQTKGEAPIAPGPVPQQPPSGQAATA